MSCTPNGSTAPAFLTLVEDPRQRVRDCSPGKSCSSVRSLDQTVHETLFGNYLGEFTGTVHPERAASTIDAMGCQREICKKVYDPLLLVMSKVDPNEISLQFRADCGYQTAIHVKEAFHAWN